MTKSAHLANFRSAMPSMLKHEGKWEGKYTHLNMDAEIIDQHDAAVVCEFPEMGEYPYIQYNHFTWKDGRELKSELPGKYKDGRLRWDTETFIGSAWESHDGIILLNLDRKDEPGARFFEMINLGATGNNRARIWHWFKDGRLFKRTLCDEWRVS